MNKDIFLENLPRQPKKEIADYLEKHFGIPVPPRYNNLNDALKSGKDFIIRSETPHEYGYWGISGLLWSPVYDQNTITSAKRITKIDNIVYAPKAFDNESLSLCSEIQKQNLALYLYGKISEIDFLKNFYNHKMTQLRDIIAYCQLINCNTDDFINTISFSYWEKISGKNISIIKDSAIPGRYHLITFTTYSVIENKKEILSEKCGVDDVPFFITNYDKLVDFYERICSLSCFESNHCPIIEMQYDDYNKLWFLQYHRSRNLELAKFKLTKAPGKKTIKAPFVRGATSEEGEIFTTRLTYPEFFIYDPHEKAGFDHHLPKTLLSLYYCSIISKIREITFIDISGKGYLPSHCRNSQLFNPRITLSINLNDFFSKKRCNEIIYNKKGTKKLTAEFKVISDGREAYVELIGDIIEDEKIVMQKNMKLAEFLPD